MLKNLILNHIILIEEADVSFGSGFTVLSGETGAGKSAIMEALKQITGARSDPKLIRKGSEKGVVEAAFNIRHFPAIVKMLEDAGIAQEDEEDLIIRREISANGKGRAFINNRLTPVSFLKEIGQELVEIVGQHASQKLLSLEQHREMLDSFGGLEDLKKAFAKSWQEEERLQRELDQLKASEAERLRELESAQKEHQEILQAALKEGEEEELFLEYTRLINVEELSRLAHGIHQALYGEEQALIPALQQLGASFDQLCRLDSEMGSRRSTFKTSILELQEISHEMLAYSSGLEFNPERLELINDRLGAITKLKKKYGPLLADVEAYQKRLEERLDFLENADSHIDDLEKALKRLNAVNGQLAEKLTQARQAAAARLAQEIMGELRVLNMPKAEFFVEITPQKRNSHGDDRIEFLFCPNVGEKRVSIRECASGGELSRVMLALQALLAGKQATPTLVFDEIDANIGGETANGIGEKLLQISRAHQVLCITHFPQVAKRAEHHLQIAKREKEGRTVSEIRSLDTTARELEIARMIGSN